MPARKARKKVVRTRKTRPAPGRKAANGLAITWEGTREAFANAESAVERRMRRLVKQGGTRTQQAAEALADWRHRFDRERRKAMKQLDQQLATFQTRARRERKALARTVEDAVQGTLAALNIPSRQEIHDLTRRVEELTRKIEGFRRTQPRRSAVRVRPATSSSAGQA